MLNLGRLALQITKNAPCSHSKFLKIKNMTRGFSMHAYWMGNFKQLACFNMKNSHWKLLKMPSNGIQGVRNKSDNTKGERDLIEMLSERIMLEHKAMESTDTPTYFRGYHVFNYGTAIKLVKDNEQESPAIFLSINGSLGHIKDDGVCQAKNLHYRPKFVICFFKENFSLFFYCSMIKKAEKGKESSPAFNGFCIEKVSVNDGNQLKSVYHANCEFLENDLLAAFKAYLAENSIDDEFIEQLCTFATGFEQEVFLELLENLTRFTLEENPDYDNMRQIK